MEGREWVSVTQMGDLIIDKITQLPGIKIQSTFNYFNLMLILIVIILFPFMGLFRDNETSNIKIPTGRRRTSWLFYKRSRGFELGTTKTNPAGC